ncbi:hypothetical protein PR048_016814 [Dryococelus australis]|uniref:Uncharacterized protein n=1 Tax=Dryococelus australis TaxID=614101 RepID=A0ABQ9H7V8_9NEOP|nr:hypothetical protein PR048_016814 [Dryococelus australis]
MPTAVSERAQLEASKLEKENFFFFQRQQRTLAHTFCPLVGAKEGSGRGARAFLWAIGASLVCRERSFSATLLVDESRWGGGGGGGGDVMARKILARNGESPRAVLRENGRLITFRCAERAVSIPFRVIDGPSVMPSGRGSYITRKLVQIPLLYLMSATTRWQMYTKRTEILRLYEAFFAAEIGKVFFLLQIPIAHCIIITLAALYDLKYAGESSLCGSTMGGNNHRCRKRHCEEETLDIRLGYLIRWAPKADALWPRESCDMPVVVSPWTTRISVTRSDDLCNLKPHIVMLVHGLQAGPGAMRTKREWVWGPMSLDAGMTVHDVELGQACTVVPVDSDATIALGFGGEEVSMPSIPPGPTFHALLQPQARVGRSVKAAVISARTRLWTSTDGHEMRKVLAYQVFSVYELAVDQRQNGLRHLLGIEAGTPWSTHVNGVGARAALEIEIGNVFFFAANAFRKHFLNVLRHHLETNAHHLRGARARVTLTCASYTRRRRIKGWGETEDPRENPPTSGIVGYHFHMRKSGGEPAGDRTRIAVVGVERPSHHATIITVNSAVTLVKTTPVILALARGTGGGPRRPAPILRRGRKLPGSISLFSDVLGRWFLCQTKGITYGCAPGKSETRFIFECTPRRKDFWPKMSRMLTTPRGMSKKGGGGGRKSPGPSAALSVRQAPSCHCPGRLTPSGHAANYPATAVRRVLRQVLPCPDVLRRQLRISRTLVRIPRRHSTTRSCRKLRPENGSMSKPLYRAWHLKQATLINRPLVKIEDNDSDKRSVEIAITGDSAEDGRSTRHCSRPAARRRQGLPAAHYVRISARGDVAVGRDSRPSTSPPEPPSNGPLTQPTRCLHRQTAVQRYDGNTARLARRSDEALGAAYSCLLPDSHPKGPGLGHVSDHPDRGLPWYPEISPGERRDDDDDYLPVGVSGAACAFYDLGGGYGAQGKHFRSRRFRTQSIFAMSFHELSSTGSRHEGGGRVLYALGTTSTCSSRVNDVAVEDRENRCHIPATSRNCRRLLTPRWQVGSPSTPSLPAPFCLRRRRFDWICDVGVAWRARLFAGNDSRHQHLNPLPLPPPPPPTTLALLRWGPTSSPSSDRRATGPRVLSHPLFPAVTAETAKCQTSVGKRTLIPRAAQGNPENPMMIKSGDTVWHCSYESIIYIQNLITPLDCQSIKALNEDCEALLLARGEGGVYFENSIRLERAFQKQSSDTHKTSYDRVKRCRKRKKNIKAPELVSVDVPSNDAEMKFVHWVIAFASSSRNSDHSSMATAKWRPEANCAPLTVLGYLPQLPPPFPLSATLTTDPAPLYNYYTALSLSR